jgi:hypothetical protein
MRVVTVVGVPVEGSPGPVVDRVVTPVPVGAPADIVGCIDEPDHRPGSNFIVCGSYHGHVVSVDCIALITGIGRLCIYGFHNVVPSVKILITDQLYPYLTVAQLLNCEDCHIL